MDSANQHDIYLEKLHDDKVRELLPAIVIIAVLMVVGLVGNVSALIFYWRQSKRSSTTFFIITLAMTDFLVCLFMALEIAEIAFTYVFTNTFACHLYIYFNHLAAVISGLILLVIAIDRYRKLCHPLKKQLTLKHAKVISVFNFSVAVFIALPVIFLYTTKEVEIENHYNSSFPVNGTDCMNRDDMDKFSLALHIVYLTVYTLCAVILIALYCLIGRVIYRYHKNHQNFKRDLTQAKVQDGVSSSSVESDCSLGTVKDLGSSSDAASSGDRTTSNTERQNPSFTTNPQSDTHTHQEVDIAIASSSSEFSTSSGDIKTKAPDRFSSSSSNYPSDTLSKEHSKTQQKSPKWKAKKKYRKTVAAIKMTIMLFVIAIIFIASYLPYHSVTIATDKTKLTELKTIGVQLALRSYLLNSVANPFIYGLFNVEFRRFFMRVAHAICRTCYAFLKCEKHSETQNVPEIQSFDHIGHS